MFNTIHWQVSVCVHVGNEWSPGVQCDHGSAGLPVQTHVRHWRSSRSRESQASVRSVDLSSALIYFVQDNSAPGGERGSVCLSQPVLLQRPPGDPERRQVQHRSRPQPGEMARQSALHGL